MNHDPLCPNLTSVHDCWIPTGSTCVHDCECRLITRVREDERAAALDAAWIAVGNVPCATTTHGDDWRDIPGSTVKRETLAAIDALREEQK